MSNEMRCLTDAEINTVAGGFLILAALLGCPDNSGNTQKHAGDTGSK